MPSLILRTATRPLAVLILLFSVFLLLRGHNEPGGGFIGGLVASGAFALVLLSNGADAAERSLRIRPLLLVPVGLGIAALSGLPGLLDGAYMLGQWGSPALPILGGIKPSTILLFDVGVYLLVIGMSTSILFGLSKERA
jgi:multicomponent Na+:H+ antiporter subunit B